MQGNVVGVDVQVHGVGPYHVQPLSLVWDVDIPPPIDMDVDEEDAQRVDEGSGEEEHHPLDEEAEKADVDDEALMDGLPDGAEGWEMIQDSSIEGSEIKAPRSGEGERDEAGVDDDRTASKQTSTRKIDPTKSDVLGFVKDTETRLREGFVFLPGQEWDGEVSDRYVELELVQPNGRLTRPGACMLTYASKVMKESTHPNAGIVAKLNTNGVDGFARKAMEIDPEEVKADEDGFLEGFLN